MRLWAIGGCVVLLASAPGCRSTAETRAGPRVRFAVAETHPRCSLHAAAGALTPEGAVRCGEAHDERERLRTWACIREAQAAGRPFAGVLHYPGVDSAVAQALLGGPDSTVRELWYDSGPTGANAEHQAHLSSRLCKRLRSHPQEPSWVECEPAGDRLSLCHGTEHELGPPQTVPSLVCQPQDEEPAGQYLCWADPPPGVPIGGTGTAAWGPPPQEAELACRTEEPGGTLFRCAANVEADAHLGLRTRRRPGR